jgi:hypothetical protein
MKVVNESSLTLAVRGFVGEVLAKSFRIIIPRETVIVPGPDLPKWGLKPYVMPGILVVRDLGFIQIDYADNSELALVASGQRTVYSRPFSHSPYFGVNEGVLIAFHKESHLIGL